MRTVADVATLTERKPGVWFARVFLPPRRDGERGRQVGKVFKGSKRAIASEVARWEAEMRGMSPSGASATIGELLTLWMDAKSIDWEPTTARDYRSRVALITEDIGAVRLLDLDPLRIDRWLADMRKRGVGEGAIRSRVAALRSAASWGVSRRLLRSNPVAEAAPRVKTGRRTVRPEPEQVVALLEAAGAESPRAALALRIAALTGAREAEIVALQWDDLVGDRLKIGRQRHSAAGEAIVRERTKTGGSRVVLLDSVTVRAVQLCRRGADKIVGAPTTWMFAEPGADEPPSPRWLYEVFMRAAKRAGVPTGRANGFVFHDLRHWAASTALRDGHDVVSVAARLGHSPETLLRVYAQEVEGGQAGVAASLAARIDG